MNINGRIKDANITRLLTPDLLETLKVETQRMGAIMFLQEEA